MEIKCMYRHQKDKHIPEWYCYRSIDKKICDHFRFARCIEDIVQQSIFEDDINICLLDGSLTTEIFDDEIYEEDIKNLKEAGFIIKPTVISECHEILRKARSDIMVCLWRYGFIEKSGNTFRGGNEDISINDIFYSYIREMNECFECD